eukprot:366006-Chlamydomonas_euryale.AAC.7
MDTHPHTSTYGRRSPRRPVDRYRHAFFRDTRFGCADVHSEHADLITTFTTTHACRVKGGNSLKCPTMREFSPTRARRFA